MKQLLLLTTLFFSLAVSFPTLQQQNATASLNTSLGTDWSFDDTFNHEAEIVARIIPGSQAYTLDIRANNRYPGLVPDPGLIVIYSVLGTETSRNRLTTFKSEGRPTLAFALGSPSLDLVDPVKPVFKSWDYRTRCPLQAAYRVLRRESIDGHFIHVRLAQWWRDPYLPPSESPQPYYVFTRSEYNGYSIDRFFYGCRDGQLRMESVIGGAKGNSSTVEEEPALPTGKEAGLKEIE